MCISYVRAEIVTHSIDSPGPGKSGDGDEGMDVLCSSVEIVAGCIILNVAVASRIERNNHASRTRQFLHHSTPCIPAFWPAGQKQNGFSFTQCDVVQQYPIRRYGMMGELLAGRVSMPTADSST